MDSRSCDCLFYLRSQKPWKTLPSQWSKLQAAQDLGKYARLNYRLSKTTTPFSSLVSIRGRVFFFAKRGGLTETRVPAEPVVVRLQEGAVAHFTVLRTGRADFVATVMYHVEYGEASPGDFTLLSNATLLVFDVGEWMKNISVALEDDDIPETDEPFYMVLSNASGESRLCLKTLIAQRWHSSLISC